MSSCLHLASPFSSFNPDPCSPSVFFQFLASLGLGGRDVSRCLSVPSPPLWVHVGTWSQGFVVGVLWPGVQDTIQGNPSCAVTAQAPGEGACLEGCH